MLASSKLPDTIGSRYQPIRVVGKGGMGVVYEVVHVRTGEHLALKVLQFGSGAPAEALERFKREARASAQIKSENVVHVSDADIAVELDDAPFLVMELLDGVDLEQEASLSKPSPATVVGWLRQIAPALDKAHRLGIIHRDLKPENLFLANVEDRPPVVKILDFGIAKMSEEGSAATASGQVLGTPKYMAPEQAARHPLVTPATDLYALGLIAYRLILGQSYYRGTVMSILAELLHGTPRPPSVDDPSFGGAFDAWFMQACHREPARRFASASKQVEALAAALGLPSTRADIAAERASSPPPGADTDLAPPATTISHSSIFQRQNTRRTLVVAGVILAAAVAVAVGYLGTNARRVDGAVSDVTPALEPASVPTVRASPGSSVTAAFIPPSPLPATEATATPAPSAASSVSLASPRAASAKSPPRPPRPAPSAPARGAPASDPFTDQK